MLFTCHVILRGSYDRNTDKFVTLGRNLGEKWHEAQVEPIDSVRAPLTKCWKSILSDTFQFALNGIFLGGAASRKRSSFPFRPSTKDDAKK